MVDYTLNGSGGILSRSEEDTTTSYVYKPGGERLDHAITTVGGASARTDYQYDAGFGDITGFGLQGQPAQATFTYDPFGRLRASDRDGRHVEYTYDGLDRRDTRAGETRTFDYSYVGLSEALSQEQEFGGDERRSYDYTSRLERLGMARRTSATGTAPYRAYSKDANGSVEGLEDSSGEVAEGDRYRYDPYGQALGADESPVENDAGLSDAARANGFRFQGQLFDGASDSYDMRARAYLPELGRFLQEDHFEDALGELELEADPLTQDRYAFGGGNPVNNIEFDGHIATTSGPQSRNVQVQGGDVIDREQGRTVSGPNAAPGPDRSGYVQPPSAAVGLSEAELTAATEASQAETETPTRPAPRRPARPPRPAYTGPRISEGQLSWAPSRNGKPFIAGLSSGDGDRCGDFLCDAFTSVVGDDLVEVGITFGGGGFGFGGKVVGKLCVKVCAGAAERVGALGSRLLGSGSKTSSTSVRSAAGAAKAGRDDLARPTFGRGRRLERLSGAGTPVGRVRNFDVPDPSAAAHRVAGSLTRGPGVARQEVREGVTVFRLPEGGQVVLRSPSASRSKSWAVDVHDVPGYPRLLTHFRPR